MKLCLVVFLTLFSCVVFAQQKKLDSLIAVNENYKKEDSLKVNYLYNVCRQYLRVNNFEKLEEYGQKAIAVALKLPQTFSLSILYNRLGLCYHGKAKYLQAIEYYNKGLEVAKRRNDKHGTANFYVNLSALYSSIPDYAKALEANELAINTYNEMGDKEKISSCYMNIGSLYTDMHQTDKALEYINKGLVVFKTSSNGFNYGVAVAYQGIARVYAQASDEDLKNLSITNNDRYKLTLDNLNTALKVAESPSDAGALIGTINNDIGQLYEQMGNNKMAFGFYEKAYSFIEKTDSKDELADILFRMGKYYNSNNNLDKSRDYLLRSLLIGKQHGLLSMQRNALEMLSNVYEKKGMADSALIYYKDYISFKETIFNEEKEKEITRKQLKIDFSIKENNYKLIQQITDGKLKQQFLLAAHQQQALQLKQQQLQLVNNEKDLQRLTYLKRQAELQNEQQLQVSLLQKNTLQSKYDKEVSSKQIAEQQLQISYDGKVKIFLAVAILLALLVTGFIFYNQRKTARLNKIISEQKISLEQLGNVKDKIFSVVSHDMRAPVNSLMSFIDILEDGKIRQEKLTLYAKELKQSLTYTSALMNNLLNWAASQMQGFKPMKEGFDFSLLVNEIINTVNHHVKQKNVFVINKVPQNTMINADRNMAAAILRNLISNAIKYSYKDGTISVQLETSMHINKFFIKDEGTGMAADDITAFNDSKNNQPTESKRGTLNEKGTGLGLLLCKTFAEQMGGEIVAQKNEKGMSFILSLPA